MANNLYTGMTTSTQELDSALQELIDRFNSNPIYTPKTAEQIQQQAQGEYQTYYDQLRLAAQQQQEQSDLALQQQRAGLQNTYDKQREASAKNYAQNYSAADRQMLSRGMQRSSYGAQTLANINRQGAEAQQEINAQQGAAEGNIDAQRAQLAQQLAQTLAGYDANQAKDVMSRTRELEDAEYNRGVQNRQQQDALAAQIYEYMAARQQQEIANNQWQMNYDEGVRQFNEQMAEQQRQFDAAQAKASAGGGPGNTNPGNTSGNTDDALKAKTQGSNLLSYQDYMNALNDTAGKSKDKLTWLDLTKMNTALTNAGTNKTIDTLDEYKSASASYGNLMRNVDLLKNGYATKSGSIGGR